MKHLIHIIIILVAVSALSGCHTAKESGYLSDYSVLGKGQRLEKVWLAPGERLLTSSKIVISEINTEYISDKKGVTVSEAVSILKQNLLKYSKAKKIDLTFERSTNAWDYDFAIAITEMTPGSAAARIIAGELGAGHAIVQVEGKLKKRTNAKEIFIFSDRRGDSAAIGFADLGGDAGPSLVKKMLERLSEDIVLEIETLVSH